MYEEELSNSISELELNRRINDVIKLHAEFKNLQIKFNEEKEKNDNLEKKNNSLENELNEMNKKIQKTNSDNQNKIQTINSDHQNEIKMLKENIQQLETGSDQKDVKINSLEERIKKANDLFEKKTGDLAIKLNVIFKYVDFVKIKNKWREIDTGFTKCCDNKCINTNNPAGNCIGGNGFANIINDEYIKYVLGKGNLVLKTNWSARVSAENSFKKPQNCFNYSLYYFEIKCIFELNKDVDYMEIGLRNCNVDKYIYYYAKNARIYHDKNEYIKPKPSWNHNDIFGCGLVYPPTNITNEFPYIFFTQNGKLIGKGVLLKDNFGMYNPFVRLRCFSVEANFGSDLESKPFTYDVSNHAILKEFY